MIKDEIWRAEKLALISRYDEENKNINPGGTVFCGSSLMERFPVEEWTNGRVINRGVGGYTIAEYSEIIDICCINLQPKDVYINIGTNDLNDDTSDIDKLIAEYAGLLKKIMDEVPGVSITVMAYYPVNDDTDDEFMKEELKFRTNELLSDVNLRLKEMADKLGLRFINVNHGITDSDGKLAKKYSVDGVHINEEGYRIILQNLKNISMNSCKC